MRLHLLAIPALPLVVSFVALAQGPDHDTHRALIQRDQQSAEFAARLRGPEALNELQAIHERQNRELAHPVRPDLRPYQRYRFFEERKSGSEPDFRQRNEITGDAGKSGSDPDFAPPLPLPGGMPRGVDPVMPQGLPY